VPELRDTAIWASTCDLTAQVLRNAPLRWRRSRPGHLMLEGDGLTYRGPLGRTVSLQWSECGPFRVVRAPLGGAGYVAFASEELRRRSPRPAGWTRRATGDCDGAFPPGTAGLPPEDLAVLLNRYRARFAPGS